MRIIMKESRAIEFPVCESALWFHDIFHARQSIDCELNRNDNSKLKWLKFNFNLANLCAKTYSILVLSSSCSIPHSDLNDSILGIPYQ